MSVSPPGCRVDLAGIEPASPARQAGIRPVGPEARFLAVETTGIEPDQAACEAASPPWYMRPRNTERDHLSPPPCGGGRKSEVRPGLEPGLPPYQRGVRPQHLQTRDNGASAGGEATVGAAAAPVFPAGR